jgi:outer membrane lipoprotein SlyB
MPSNLLQMGGMGVGGMAVAAAVAGAGTAVAGAGTAVAGAAVGAAVAGAWQADKRIANTDNMDTTKYSERLLDIFSTFSLLYF